MTDYFILDENRKPIPCRDVLKWTQWFETADRKIKETYVKFLWKKVHVSTVFLGLNHQFSPEENIPLLYETMVFAPWGFYENIDCERASTEKEAIKIHDKMVARYSKLSIPFLRLTFKFLANRVLAIAGKH